MGVCRFVCGCAGVSVFAHTMSFLPFGPDFVALCAQIFGMTLHLSRPVSPKEAIRSPNGGKSLPCAYGILAYA